MYPTCMKSNIPKRFIIVGMVFISTLYIYYLHTNVSMAVVSMTAPTRGSNSSKPEFEWSSKERAVVISSFNYGRLLGPLGGILAGKLGGSTFFAITIMLSTVITILTPFLLKMNFYLFISANLGVGILETFGFTSFIQLWSRWATPNERSTFISFTVIGIYAGSIMSYLVSSYILRTYSWPILYYVSGAIGFVWFWIWHIFVSNDPESDNRITEAERKYLAEQINNTPSEKLIYPWKQICTSPSVLITCLGKFSIGCGNAFIIGYLPQYIKDVSHLNIGQIGYISTIPMVFAFISMPTFGYLFYFIRRKNITSLTNLHRRFGSIGLFLGGSITLLMSLWTSLTGSIICISAYQFVITTYIIDSQTLILDLAPRYAAFLNGHINFFFTLGSIFSPTFVGFVVTGHSVYQWGICFVTFSAFYFLAAACCLKFVSGDLQPWADYKIDKIEKNLESSKEPQ